MLCLDKERIINGLDMDDESLVESNSCEIIYIRDQLISVIKYPGEIPEGEILSFKERSMQVRLKGISCWLPVKLMKDPDRWVN